MCIEAVVIDGEWMKPDGTRLWTGEHVHLVAFHGEGRDDKDAIYAPGICTSVFGPGRYSATNKKDAQWYGPNVKKIEVTLLNPLVIATESELASVCPGGVLPGRNEERMRAIAFFRCLIRGEGYDGVIVNIGDGQAQSDGSRNKQLRAFFQNSTVFEPGRVAIQKGCDGENCEGNVQS